MDREKVISGLQRCRLVNKVNCDKCPYDYNGRGNGKSECTAELATDAIELLKKQDETIKELQNAYGYLQKQFFEAQDKLFKEQAKTKVVFGRAEDGEFVTECGN